jgi:hypothetical protein
VSISVVAHRRKGDLFSRPLALQQQQQKDGGSNKRDHSAITSGDATAAAAENVLICNKAKRPRKMLPTVAIPGSASLPPRRLHVKVEEEETAAAAAAPAVVTEPIVPPDHRPAVAMAPVPMAIVAAAAAPLSVTMVDADASFGMPPEMIYTEEFERMYEEFMNVVDLEHENFDVSQFAASVLCNMRESPTRS